MLWIKRCFGKSAAEDLGQKGGDKAADYKEIAYTGPDITILDHQAFLNRFRRPEPRNNPPTSPAADSNHNSATCQPVNTSNWLIALACSVQAQQGPTGLRPRRSFVVDEGGDVGPQLMIRVIWVTSCQGTEAGALSCPGGLKAGLAPSTINPEIYQRMLDELSQNDHEFLHALREVSRASHMRSYCTIVHKLRSGFARECMHGVVRLELGTCCLSLGGGREVPGFLLVARGSLGQPPGDSTAGPSQHPASRCSETCSVKNSLRRGIATSKASPLKFNPKPKQTSPQGVDLRGAARVPSYCTSPRPSPRLESMTTKMRVEAAARAVAAEVLPASIIMFTYGRGNMLAEVTYLNSRAREYLCLAASGQAHHHPNMHFMAEDLAALPARALLTAILQHEPSYMMRQLHQAAASDKGFSATLKVPAYIDAAALTLAYTCGIGSRASAAAEDTLDDDDGDDDDDRNDVNGSRRTPLRTISDISEDKELRSGQGQSQGQAESVAHEFASCGSRQLSICMNNGRARTSMGLTSFRITARRGSMIAGGSGRTTTGMQVASRAMSMRQQNTTFNYPPLTPRTRTAGGLSQRSTDVSLEHLMPKLRTLSRAVLSVHGDMLRSNNAGLTRSSSNPRAGRLAPPVSASRGEGGWGSGGSNGQSPCLVSPKTSRRRLLPHASSQLTATPVAMNGLTTLKAMGHTLDTAEQELLRRIADPKQNGHIPWQRGSSRTPVTGPVPLTTSTASTHESMRDTGLSCAKGPLSGATGLQQLRYPIGPLRTIRSDLLGGQQAGAAGSLTGLSKEGPSIGGEGVGVGYRLRHKKPAARRVMTLAPRFLQQRVTQAMVSQQQGEKAGSGQVAPEVATLVDGDEVGAVTENSHLSGAAGTVPQSCADYDNVPDTPPVSEVDTHTPNRATTPAEVRPRLGDAHNTGYGFEISNRDMSAKSNLATGARLQSPRVQLEWGKQLEEWQMVAEQLEDPKKSMSQLAESPHRPGGDGTHRPSQVVQSTFSAMAKTAAEPSVAIVKATEKERGESASASGVSEVTVWRDAAQSSAPSSNAEPDEAIPRVSTSGNGPRGLAQDAWPCSPRLDLIKRAYRTVGDVPSAMALGCSRLSGMNASTPVTNRGSSQDEASTGGSDGSVWQLRPATSAPPQLSPHIASESVDMASPRNEGPTSSQSVHEAKHDGCGGEAGQRNAHVNISHGLGPEAESVSHGQTFIRRMSSSSRSAALSLYPSISSSGPTSAVQGPQRSNGYAGSMPLHRVVLQQMMPSKLRMSSDSPRNKAAAVEMNTAAITHFSAADSRECLFQDTSAALKSCSLEMEPATEATVKATPELSSTCINAVSASADGLPSDHEFALHTGANLGFMAFMPSSGSIVDPSTLYKELHDAGLPRRIPVPNEFGRAATTTSEWFVQTAQPPGLSGAPALSLGGSSTGSVSALPAWRLSNATSSATPVRNGRRGNSVRARVQALLDQAEQVQMRRAGSNNVLPATTVSQSHNFVSLRPNSIVDLPLLSPSGSFPAGGGGGDALQHPRICNMATLPQLRPPLLTRKCNSGTVVTAPFKCTSLDLMKNDKTSASVDNKFSLDTSGGGHVAGYSTVPAFHCYNSQHSAMPVQDNSDVCGSGDTGGHGVVEGVLPFAGMGLHQDGMLQILGSTDGASGSARGDGSRFAGGGSSGTAPPSDAYLHYRNYTAVGGVKDVASGGSGCSRALGSDGDGMQDRGRGIGEEQRQHTQKVTDQKAPFDWLPSQKEGVDVASVLMHERGGIMTALQPYTASMSLALESPSQYSALVFHNANSGGLEHSSRGGGSGIDGGVAYLETALMSHNVNCSSYLMHQQGYAPFVPAINAAGLHAVDVQAAGDRGSSLCGSVTMALGGPTGTEGVFSSDGGVGGAVVPPAPAVAWCHMRARTCNTVDGRRVLLLIMSDVTKQILDQERLAGLVEQEHRILEALFPRHVIAYLTSPTATGGEDDDAASSGGGRNGGSDHGASAPPGLRYHSCGQQPRRRCRDRGAELPLGPSESGARGVFQLRQMALQHQLNTLKVSRLATEHKMVTIMFSDIVGFTAFSRQVTPLTVMRFLNELYQKLDALLDIYKVYKVETIGDCYVVAGGLVRYDEDGLCTVLSEGEVDELHAVRVMEYAKAMLRASREVSLPTTGEPVQVRLGLHSGPAMSGVVGSKMPRFTVFGETVEGAHRMESGGKPGRIHVSGVTRELLRSESWEATEGVHIEGHGCIGTYLWVQDDDDSSHRQRVMDVYL